MLRYIVKVSKGTKGCGGQFVEFPANPTNLRETPM